MIKIVHLITDLDTGGAEMMLFKVLSRTDLTQFVPVVISLKDRGTLGQRLQEMGIPVYTVGMKSGIPTPQTVLRLIRTIRKIRPDLIQGWMYHGNLAAQFANGFLTAPVPVLWNIRQSLYSLKYEKKSSSAIISLGRLLSGSPKHILYNSKTSAAQHEAFGYKSDKRIIIPNGFEPSIFRPSVEARMTIRSELGLSEKTLLIGQIGRYHPMKDHHNFLQAARHLLDSHTDVHFLLAGHGIDHSNSTLSEQILQLRLSNNVHLLGERQDIPTVTASMDIATSSSYTEAFPNVIGEAMSCAVCCVVTDVGDSAAIVGNTGRIVPSRNSKAMADAWSELIDLKEEGLRSMGLSARERIIKQYSLDSVVAKYEEMYKNILL